MKCPHCLDNFCEVGQDGLTIWQGQELGIDINGAWFVRWVRCPGCKKLIIFLESHKGGSIHVHPNYPKSMARSPLPPAVPEEYASDYKEACNVLPESAKASAAISRRLLQHLLREKGGVKHSDLAREIQEVIDSGKLPSYLTTAVDGVRNIGNFGTHPIKSTNTGEIIDVEPGEAEWLLDTLEGLFDFYFVQPTILQKKRDALDQKLKEAGKPPMK